MAGGVRPEVYKVPMSRMRLTTADKSPKADKEDKLENWVNKLVENVNPSLSGYTKEQVDLAAGLLIYELYSRDGSYRKIYESYSSVVRGGVK